MTVTDDLAARHLITQGVKVFSTPEMVRFMERCVVDGLQPYLAPGQNMERARQQQRVEAKLGHRS